MYYLYTVIREQKKVLTLSVCCRRFKQCVFANE